MNITFKEKLKMMKGILKDKNVEKDIRLTIALELLYQYEISLDEFKNVLEELDCYDDKYLMADKKTDEFWEEILNNRHYVTASVVKK